MQSMLTRRAFLVEPKRFEIRTLDVNPGPGQVLVKVAACGLCNWEQNHWHGLLGQCPQNLGHEWGGTVIAVGDGVMRLQPGDNVTALPDSMTGFSDYVVTKAPQCFKLAPGVAPEDALGEPLKCVVTVLRAASPQAGDYGVVVGCGPMGLWCIQGLAGSSLAALIAVDVSPDKLSLAQHYGATHTVNPRAEDAVACIGAITGGHMADFVIEGTGLPGVAGQVAGYLRTGRGRFIMMSSHERPAHEFDWRPFQDKGAIISVAHPGYSEDQLDDTRRAVSLINKGTFRMQGIVSHRFPLERVQEAFETLEHKPADYVKGIVVP